MEAPFNISDSVFRSSVSLCEVSEERKPRIYVPPEIIMEILRFQNLVTRFGRESAILLRDFERKGWAEDLLIIHRMLDHVGTCSKYW
jgi:hypothetical protein